MSQPEILSAGLESPFPQPGTPRPLDGARHQAWCSAEIPLGADRCPKCHLWQPGNGGALQHGRYSQQSIESPEALAAMSEKRTALERHLGDTSVIQQDLIEDYATVDVLIATMRANIAQFGVLSPKGRRRAATNLLLQLLDRRFRLAQVLGLSRRARQIDLARELSGLSEG